MTTKNYIQLGLAVIAALVGTYLWIAIFSSAFASNNTPDCLQLNIEVKDIDGFERDTIWVKIIE